MTLREFLDRAERSPYTITVYAPRPQPDLIDQFETRAVSATYTPLPDAAQDEGFLVVQDADGFVASIGLAAVREFLEPPLFRPWDDAFADANYRTLLELLDTTLWYSLSRRQLLATSREIEDRAWRVGTGTLRVGFQRLSILADQRPVYERLAAETDLEIHVYGVADEVPPSRAGITVHAVGDTGGDGGADDADGSEDEIDDGGNGDGDTDDGAPPDSGNEETDGDDRSAADGEIGSFWFLSFDGGDDERQACALLAEERGDGEFAGFWTYDTGFVAEIDSYVRETYG